MDNAGISISKMRKLTGMNHEVVKNYYEDNVIRIYKEILARIANVLQLHGANIDNLVEYIPQKKKDANAKYKL